ncbi:MAG: hypothetical protein ACI841_003260, partial [Planctomycetota bacterium]
AIVINRDSRALLYRNVYEEHGNWLSARPVEYGRDALGASVMLTLGERTLRRECKPGGSYCSASDPRAHFGLGDESAARELRVRWIDGIEERFGPLDVNQVHELVRGEGRSD